MKLNIQHPQPGIYPPDAAPMADYHKCHAIGRSALKILDEGMPADLEHYLIHGIASSAAMSFGTAFGLLLSEPHEFKRQVILRPAFAGANAPEEFRGTGSKQRIADWRLRNADKIQLDQAEWDQAHLLAKVVTTTPAAAEILNSPQLKVEHSFVWQDKATQELVKARPDYWRPDIQCTADLKVTSGDLTDRELANYCASYYVAMQGSMCGAGLIANGQGFRAHFVIFASRKNHKCRVVVMAVDEPQQVPSWLEVGDAQFEATLAEYAQCKASGHFEDWGARGTLLEVPAYVACKLSAWKHRVEVASTPSTNQQ